MATASRTTRVKQVTHTETVPVIVLELSKDEAETLATILNKIGGRPTGARGYADAVGAALRAAGVDSYAKDHLVGGHRFARVDAIYFADEER